MKNARQIIGCRKAKKGDDLKNIGRVTFGKSRPDPTKYVLVDIHIDDKAEKELYECGMMALKHDPETVIQYVIVKALSKYAEHKR